MRVDLALQHIKFAFSSFILFPYDFFHQFGILPVGFLNGLSQMPDLCWASDCNLFFFSFLIFTHLVIQFHNRP